MATTVPDVSGAAAADEHPIQNRYCFWYMKRGRGRAAESYADSIKPLGSFGTVRRSLAHCVGVCVCVCRSTSFGDVSLLPLLPFCHSPRTISLPCFCVQVEGFWQVYSHMVRPSDVNTNTTYHLFKESIKPMWEVCNRWVCSLLTDTSTTLTSGSPCPCYPPQHEANARGGKWMIRLRKGLSTYFWEELVRTAQSKAHHKMPLQ